ncbi:tail tape measure protein [Novosphingobium sp. 9]|uniref:tail tape measure protein n=1 Tax=Novosphingobium sp. 9 TaxID=2025349 RepID=UPI0021B59A2B|nr:tail tape measure protein [Novosphingobium sp. 9]
MADDADSLIIDVRASTDGFAQDIAAMRKQIDGDLTGGFTRAGSSLQSSLASAIKQGSLGFDDLKRVAVNALGEIAASAAQGLVGGSAGVGTSAGTGSASLGGLVTSLLGLPGRATGGNVAPGSAYVVGERGPELFVPTSAGRIDSGASGSSGGRSVSVAINMTGARGASVPQSLRRSSRQIASAVRRALNER